MHCIIPASRGWLNVWSEVGFEEDKLDVGGAVCNLMASKVIESQCDMLIFTVEVVIKFLDPFFEKLCCYPCGLIVLILKTIVGWCLLVETSGLLQFPNVKHRPFLSAGLVANKHNSNLKSV